MNSNRKSTANARPEDAKAGERIDPAVSALLAALYLKNQTPVARQSPRRLVAGQFIDHCLAAEKSALDAMVDSGAALAELGGEAISKTVSTLEGVLYGSLAGMASLRKIAFDCAAQQLNLAAEIGSWAAPGRK